MQSAHSSAWRAMALRGFGDLSPPEAHHAMLELPTNRAEYVGVLRDICGYPRQSPIGVRTPSPDDIRELKRARGRWRAVVPLNDERALRTAASLFTTVFVLDPLFDSNALLYAAWHDAVIRDEHSRRLAEHAGMLVRAAPLIESAVAVLAPDHLPGSWNPRPAWRPPRPNADRRELAAWAMRTALVLVYWADRLDAFVCAATDPVAAGLDVLLGAGATAADVEVREPRSVPEAASARLARSRELRSCWATARMLSRRRSRRRLDDVAESLTRVGEVACDAAEPVDWRLVLGEPGVPDPAMVLRRVANGQEPDREPPLPSRRLERRPLCLLPLSA